MNEHSYILEKYKGLCTRYHCPNCNKKELTRYIEIETMQHIHSTVGKCNRLNKCDYHLTPKEYFKNNNISFDKKQPFQYPIKKIVNDVKPINYIPNEVFKASLKGYDNNNFAKFLNCLFGPEKTTEVINKYNIGTSKQWNGANIFWQKDIKGNIRTGKIMLYSPTNGKRIKEPYNHINWVHSVLKIQDYKQCLLGEHLLNDDETKPIAIVESEKTAIISSIYLPQFIWVAVGSLQNLTNEKCKVLKGRKIVLYPDLNAFEKWKNKAKELSHIATFKVSTLLERKATNLEKEQGLDIADYLIKYDYKEVCKTNKPTIIKEFENWLIQNPNGGTFNFEKNKFQDEGYENETFKITLNEKA